MKLYLVQTCICVSGVFGKPTEVYYTKGLFKDREKAEKCAEKDHRNIITEIDTDLLGYSEL